MRGRRDVAQKRWFLNRWLLLFHPTGSCGERRAFADDDAFSGFDFLQDFLLRRCH